MHISSMGYQITRTVAWEVAVSDDDEADDDNFNDNNDDRSAGRVTPWSTPRGMRTCTWSDSGPPGTVVTCLCPWPQTTSSSASSGEISLISHQEYNHPDCV